MIGTALGNGVPDDETRSGGVRSNNLHISTVNAVTSINVVMNTIVYKVGGESFGFLTFVVLVVIVVDIRVGMCL